MAKDTELDFDNMSDEDFLKMEKPTDQTPVEDPQPAPEPTGEVDDQNTDGNDDDAAAQAAATDDANQTPNPEEDPEGQTPVADDDESFVDGGEPDASGGGDPSGEPVTPEGEEDPDGSKTPEGNTDPLVGEGKPAGEEADPAKGDKPKADAGEEGKDPADGTKPKKDDEPVKLDEAQTAQAVDFFKKITAPFKADGKDFHVRTPEDAIRLMQQGVNYSRRMQEIKPMKALNRMLTDHGLADEAKISFLIDVAKGDKTAITKLLKDNNLDPMDLDTSAEVRYQAKSYAGNADENAFRDALDTAMSNPEGQALVSEIHNTWDDASKQQLQKNPALLGNLTEMKQTGVYSKIADELTYQRSMGYLTDVPYLQAFDQVGEAMKNAGVFGKQPAPAAVPMGQLQQQNPPQGQPVVSGARKAQAPKKAAPNPHLSSTPPAKQSKTPAKPAEPDFAKLSDEDFLKMEPPT